MHSVCAHGATIPALGFGTWTLRGDSARHMTAYALDLGYRHIDTAQMYGNEAEVGAAIRAASVARDGIFLTTKIWPDRFRQGDLQRSVEESLRKLQTEAVDLLLLHWPNPSIPLEETLGALNEVKRKGQARHIGISNFNTALIDRALAESEAPLVMNQVEYHPFLSQAPVLAKLRANGMALTAYSPLAKGRVFSDPALQAIAAEHGKNPGQVALRWLIQQEAVCAIPRSSREAHAASNLAVFDFSLTADEMAAISALAEPEGRLIDPAGMAPDWDQ